MEKHRGFPSRLPGTDLQFTIRHENRKKGATPLAARERFRDRKAMDRSADAAFMRALWEHFGEEPFVRGNLDAGRLSWLLGREVVPVLRKEFEARRPAHVPSDPPTHASLVEAGAEDKHHLVAPAQSAAQRAAERQTATAGSAFRR